MTATTSMGRKALTEAKPTPVANISTLAPSSRVRTRARCPIRPTAMVRAAEPSRVPVTIVPIWKGENPSEPR